jgi:hypothetical protein
MRTVEAGSSRNRGVRAVAAILAMLAVGAWASAQEQEAVVVDESTAEITARVAVSAGELAGSVRSLEGSLRSAAPAVGRGGVVSAEEYDALAEAGAKQQLARLADELEQLSTALASGADPAGEKALLESIARRAAALGQLGASPARVPIPPELQAELLALWNDVKALSENRPAPPPPDEIPQVAAP